MTDSTTDARSERSTFEEALDQAAALIATDPATALERAHSLASERRDPRALRIAAAALRALGRNEEAEKAELGAIGLGIPPQLKEALAALHLGRTDTAKAIADDYLSRNADDLLGMTVAAQVALALRDTSTAEMLARQALARALALPQAAMLLANSLEAQLRLREAISVMKGLRQRLPQDAIVLRYLADLHAQTGNPAEAARLYAEVLSAQPNNADTLFRYAQNLRAAGRREESIAALRRATDIAPFAGQAWWVLAHYFPEELEEDDLRKIRDALARVGPESRQGDLLRIALSFIHDRRGEHEAAFETISTLKAARRPPLPYDPDALSRHVDELIGAFTPELLSERSSEGSPSNAPVFIVGMPRSGSTLVERILGMHSRIEPIGEVRILPRALDQTAELPSDRSLLPGSVSAAKLHEMANWYLDRSEEFRRTDKPFFVDKRNANWIHAGMIRLMFPNAKIIDVRRGAVDGCWSMFKILFGDEYANDQRHLARYYADYVRLMEAIASESPRGLLMVRYEELVGDLEGQTRRMLDFIGLPYEHACVDFHRSNAAVATPSSEQVRRPINDQSIGTATPYLKRLGPLVEELERRGVMQ